MDIREALTDAGFTPVGKLTKAGRLLEETFFNDAGLCVTINYTYLKEFE